MSARGSPSSSGLLPMPGSASSSWPVYAARMNAIFRHPDMKVVLAFWLFGLINNVLYVIILSAAQDLVGSLPKGLVLLADVLPSFFTKLLGPYFIHRIPYSLRIIILISLSSIGMLLVALTPPSTDAATGLSAGSGAVAVKMFGVVLASLSSGAGEMSFLGLTHYYGNVSLAGWGSGTGAAGLVGAGMYVVLTEWWRFSVRSSLLFSAFLPLGMLVSFFGVLPREPLRRGEARRRNNVGYGRVPTGARDGEEDGEGEGEGEGVIGDVSTRSASAALLAPESSVASIASRGMTSGGNNSLQDNLRKVKALVIPYMGPLFLVYVAEYTINIGIAPTLLFPVAESPFREFRGFYPFYSFLYQLGVFISRSSIPFFRIYQLYLPSLLQLVNLAILLVQAILYFLPSVWIVFIIIFWEGLLGGAVYVNSFAAIMEEVADEDREFSLSATSVSDSAGICVAGFLGIAIEPRLCAYQVAHGRDWCRKISVQQG